MWFPWDPHEAWAYDQETVKLGGLKSSRRLWDCTGPFTDCFWPKESHSISPSERWSWLRTKWFECSSIAAPLTTCSNSNMLTSIRVCLMWKHYLVQRFYDSLMILFQAGAWGVLVLQLARSLAQKKADTSHAVVEGYGQAEIWPTIHWMGVGSNGHPPHSTQWVFI